jgi:geranylgeranyl pyrophosphate synthase
MVISTTSEVDFRFYTGPGDGGRTHAGAGGQSPSNLKLALNHLLSSGGKRAAGNRAAHRWDAGGRQDDLVTLAAAIELLHTATLVHDDLIDDSLLRRGIRPSMPAGLPPPPC